MVFVVPQVLASTSESALLIVVGILLLAKHFCEHKLLTRFGESYEAAWHATWSPTLSFIIAFMVLLRGLLKLAVARGWLATDKRVAYMPGVPLVVLCSVSALVLVLQVVL